MFDDDDFEDPVKCAYCDVWADFDCDQCGNPICIDHTEPAAPRTNYCTACMGKAIAKAEAADDHA